MSSRKSSQSLVFIFIIGGTLVVLILAMLMGSVLARGMPANIGPTESFTVTMPPSNTPLPTLTSTATPFPIDTLDEEQPQGVSNVYIEFILDASGSMLEELPDGALKRDAARNHLLENLKILRAEDHIGLRAYGHRIPYTQTQESCRDVQLVAPVDVKQKAMIARWLQDFTTQGMTPIHRAVDLALQDFDTRAPGRINNIVLISDGIETCGGDPCMLVERARTQGINFTIHVVGLNVDANTRTQLSCIAKKGGGIYYDTRSSTELKQALDSIEADIRVNEHIVSYADATATARPPTLTPAPSATPIPPTRTRVPATRTQPPPTRPSTTPTRAAACATPIITEFYAAAPPAGSTARFELHYTVQGANKVEIFGNEMKDPRTGSFPIWDDSIDWWVLTAINSCGFTEKAIHVNPDSITPPGAGFGDVDVDRRDITISVRDNALIDGDRIDLFVNGIKVLNNYTLTSSSYGVRVTLNTGQNIVTVTALNEGTSSPNTVEVSISNVTRGNPVQVSGGLSTGQSASFSIYAP